MAVPTNIEVQNPDHSFLENSHLTYLVPYATDFQVEDAFSQHDSASKGPFDGIEQREWLFFGTCVLPACSTYPSSHNRSFLDTR